MRDALQPTGPLGATPAPEGGFRFRVWAPRAKRVAVSYVDPRARRFPLEPSDRGYFSGTDPSARAGLRYWIRVDGRRWPDPASRSQPDGERGPSELVDLRRAGPPTAPALPLELGSAVLYELHVGAFTPDGTLDRAIDHLAGIAEIGVTAVELLPVPEGGGERGWGYGGVHQFAVRRAYGGPLALRRFVDAAHALGLSVVLDVVYNHWGREAVFLERFAPYFHPRASTPWGPTPNLSGPGSDEVRRYFLANATMWLEEFGVDGFRLDAVHEVFDRPDRPFWAEFSEHCHALAPRLGRRPVLIAESDLNDVRILRGTRDGGWGIDAQWDDDFHHALHAAVTGERIGYYADYGAMDALAQVHERPFLFEGQYSVVRQRRFGAPSSGVSPEHFVVFDQNHDQVGNRGDGARLISLVGPRLARVSVGLTLLSPYVPMLFMGEEFGERRPFYFFGDPPRRFAARVAAGRMRQLRENGFSDPPPDPSEPSTLTQSQLDWESAGSAEGRSWTAYVAALLRARRTVPAFRTPGPVRALAGGRWLAVRRSADGTAAVVLANLGRDPMPLPPLGWAGRWREILRSDPGESDGWGGAEGIRLDDPPQGPPIPPESLVVLAD